MGIFDTAVPAEQVQGRGEEQRPISESSDIAALETRLRERFDVVEHRLEVGARPFDLRHPRSADALIDDAEFNKDERLPYWAEIWPSAYVLAGRILGGFARRAPSPSSTSSGQAGPFPRRGE